MTASMAAPHEVQPEYAQLLAQTLPAVIQTEARNEKYLGQVAELLSREESLSPAEAELLRLLTLLIEDFEERNYALPRSSPPAAITFLMDQHKLKQKDLTEVFGTPSITSEILNGKRRLNTQQIRRLCARFHVSPDLFF